MRESYEERGYDARRRQRVRRSSGNEYARIMQGRTEDEDWEDDWEEDLEEETVPKRRRGQEGRGNRSVHRQEESAGKRSSYGSHKRKKSSHKALKILLAVLVLVAGFFFVKNLMTGQNWTVAVFGVDSREGKLERGTNSDVIMVANINRKTGEVKLVSVYRDTYLKINDEGEYHKINEAYAQGGHEQAVKALEENLDLQIDDYVTFSWAAVANGINALGGIDLEISDAEFYYINAFITETVNATGIGSVQLTHAGMNHLDGVQAVAYGRLRLMDTDFNRTARQRKVISLAVEKAKTADLETLRNAAGAVLSNVSTSIGIDDILPLLQMMDRFQISESTGFPFSRETMRIGSKDCVIPTTLESNVVTLHQLLYGEEAYTPSARVKEISQRIASDSGLTEAGENAPEAGTGGGITPKDPAPAPAETEPAEPVTEPSAETESESLQESESETESEGAAEETSEGETSSDEEETKETAESGGEGREPEETKPQEGSRPAKEPETEAISETPQETEAPVKPTPAPTAPAETAPAPTAPEPAETQGPGAGMPEAEGQGPAAPEEAPEAGPGV